MGTWSHEPFANDDAGDWLSELSESNDFSVIEGALNSLANRPNPSTSRLVRGLQASRNRRPNYSQKQSVQSVRF